MMMQAEVLYSKEELYDAAQTDEIMPVYQPIVDTRSGNVTGVEVLLRWTRKDGIELSPEYFIPAFTACGLINQLTQSLLRKVSTDLNTLGGKIRPLELHINFSTLHIQSDDFVRDCFSFLATLNKHGISLVVEITEVDPVVDMPAFKRNMNRIRAAGVKFYLDDFGTGNANIDSFLNLDVDGIKIDKIFTRKISTQHRAKYLIQFIINLATYWNIEVIAEGIEKNEQMNSLKELKVYIQQGYLFYKPLKVKDLEPLLLDRMNDNHQLIF